MAMVALEGAGVWMPALPGYLQTTSFLSAQDGLQLDADEEEAQFIGAVTIAGGGSKTFGTSSTIGWLVGSATITFLTGSTLRIGIKQASKVTTTAGPPARATLGAAAFDVWDDLVGGTDTLTALAWREDTMTAGTPLTVADGDLLAVCFHLNVTTGTPVVKLRINALSTAPLFATITLVTSGPTYAQFSALSNIILKFDDGTLGWLEPTKVCSVVDSVSAQPGINVSMANIIQVPFSCQIDALAATLSATTNAADFALELLSTPLATPTVIESLACDANILGAVATSRFYSKRFVAPHTLAANTSYAIALKQVTAVGITTLQYDVANVNHFSSMGMGTHCYAANSTAGATFVAQNSGLRRYHIWMRVSALDDGAGGALRTSSPMRRQALRFARSSR